MATAADLRRLALALDEVTEVPHVDRAAFRTPRRIFATLAPDERTANVMLAPMQQSILVGAHPEGFAPVPGGWGRMGWTTVTLAKVTVAELKAVLIDAHAGASQPAKRRATGRSTGRAGAARARTASKPRRGK